MEVIIIMFLIWILIFVLAHIIIFGIDLFQKLNYLLKNALKSTFSLRALEERFSFGEPGYTLSTADWMEMVRSVFQCAHY